MLIAGLSARADGDPKITRIGIDNGLSNNSVRCIFQDRKGFVWIGTYDGLNRYDGTSFKIYRNRPNDSLSLPHNYIYSIFEDSDQQFWVGTGQGLVLMDRTSSRFLPAYCYRTAADRLDRINININLIASDQSGNTLIGTNGWGLLVKKAGQPYPRQVFTEINGANSDGYIVRGFAFEGKNRWVFVADKGLCLYDPVANNLTVADAAVKYANAIVADDKGNIWVGAENGLYQFSIGKRVYTRHYTQADGSLPFDMISSLYCHPNGELWIGTEGGGAAMLSTSTGKFRYLKPGKGPANLSSEAVYAIASDKEGRLWLGTHKGGCNIVDESTGRFTTISNDPFRSNSLVSDFVYSFGEGDSPDEVFIGTDGGGLSLWNRHANSFRNYSHQPAAGSSLSHNAVTDVFTDHTGSVWVATLGGGVNRFNKKAGTFEHFNCINEANGVENKHVLSIFEDRNKRLWATTFGKLYYFDRSLNRFRVFSQAINDPISIFEDRKGVLWIGNFGQLVRIDHQDKQHAFFEIGKPVRAIHEDARGQFWLGTEGGGLVQFDRNAGRIVRRFTDANGLCNNGVLNILEDGKGGLWLSTFNGLSRFDPANAAFRNFYQSDGLQSNQFSYRAACKLSSGEMLFGGVRGFNIFHPDSIVTRSYMPPVFITDILINSRNLEEAGDSYISKRNADQVQELTVPYNEAILSVRFSALEFSSPEKISYAYYLEGWDRDWTYSGNTRSINYNNLREGRYVLHVKSTNAAGVWNNKETTLNVVVLPPWYRSWWAYALYILAIGTIVFLVYRYRVQQAMLKFKVKLAHMNAEKEKEINEKRQSFFTNIAHEFRTPLTLIINPMNDILKKEEDENQKAELGVVYRNARRLLSMVDQLLLFRKAESDTSQVKIAKCNFYQLCHDTYLYFVQQAKMKQIDYRFVCNQPELEIYGDQEKLEIILFNLLSNAIKYTPDNGKVVLEVEDRGNSIHLAVQDSGAGIPADVGNKLFEKFYQVKEKGKAAKPGFGIGLYLVKDFVEKHHGVLSYSSTIGSGTIFSIEFLKGVGHFDASQLVETSESTSMVDELAAGVEEYVPMQQAKSDGLESIVTERQSILLVDDNAQMRDYLAQIFRRDFEVYEAADGSEGLSKAREHLPDVIISDVMMDNMSGIDFCKNVKESPTLNHIPFILITGSYSPESKMKGIEYGADDYITKPFEKDLLVARVQSLIKKQQNLQKYFYNEITHQKHYHKVSEEYKEFLEACYAIVEKHLENDDFNIQVLATEIGMSHSKLYKTIKTISGQSANAFIRYIRLRKAAEMFINTNYNVNQTAFYVGIKDIKYFREQFTKTFGMKPSDYIVKYRKTLGKNYRLNEKVTRDKID